MPVARGSNFKSIPLNVCGSSVYGLYSKMDNQVTYNMYMSDQFLVPYPGYKIGIESSFFNDAKNGRGIYESIKLNRVVAVFDNQVYLIDLNYNHTSQNIGPFQVSNIGELQTSQGVVYITENNKPQILISDGSALYVYDQDLDTGSFVFTADNATETLTFSTLVSFAIGEPITLTNSGGALPTGLFAGVTYYVTTIENPTESTTSIQLASSQQNAGAGTAVTFSDDGSGTNSVVVSGRFYTVSTDFTPGYVSFHDTYFLAAASHDTFYSPAANNTWRLSAQNNGFVWQSIAQTVGLLETKPDNTQAVVRFPSKGNMILVMGETVTEYWFDTGAQLFPYQRTNQGSIDYGCLNPATVASMDEIVIWLARNEKSGPIIMYTTGGEPEKITTDGIDYQLSEIDSPQDSQGFIYRKNGHLFYHLNFYSDNISFVVDLTLKKIFNACDQDRNYYIMGQVVWFKNQYFSVTKNNGNFFIFDTVFTTYDNVLPNGEVVVSEIPRVRICDNIRLPSQDYFILNDVGFTIETGETDYQFQNQGPIFLITQDGNKIITEDTSLLFIETQDGNNIEFQNDNLMLSEQPGAGESDFLIAQQDYIVPVTPRVDMAVSYDGGASFSSEFPYVLNPIGKRRNRLMWWQGGLVNDCVVRFTFWGIGRVVATDGVANIRQ